MDFETMILLHRHLIFLARLVSPIQKSY